MRKILSIFIIVIGLFGPAFAQGFFDYRIQDAGFQYGGRRPFSFYYPYNYKYYSPSPWGSDSCQWLYTNGSYVYYCN